MSACVPRLLRDRVKYYDMIHCVKEKKKLCTFPIYSIISIIYFIFIFTSFLSSQVIAYLSSSFFFFFCLLFMFISPEDQCNAFMDAVFYLHVW